MDEDQTTDVATDSVPLHELRLTPDSRYGHLFYPRCLCGSWAWSGAITKGTAEFFYGQHLATS